MELCHLGSAPNSQGHSGTVTSHFTLSLSIFFFQMVSGRYGAEQVLSMGRVRNPYRP